MEDTCEFLSNYGIPRKSDIFIVSRLNIYEHQNKQYKNGTIIYLKIEFIREFARVLLPLIQYKFILVSGLSDYTCPQNLFPNSEVEPFINNSNLIHWYVCNCTIKHTKITLLPIGIDYWTISPVGCSAFFGNKMSPIDQETEFKEIISTVKPINERIIKCYSNFHFADYGRLFGESRKDIINIVPTELVFYEPAKLLRIQSWKNQSEYAFILSPHGHGMDCYRTWEALLLGCIVIVKTSPLDGLYTDLPVLILNNWTDLTQELLIKTASEFRDNTYNYDKLTLDYWMKQIQNHQPEI